jgi:ribosomal protein S18 acetylase RimI-like enzyme
MEALLQQMRADGIKGVSFGVNAANERAIGFYRHMGFQELVSYEEDDGAGITFCMSFDE